MEIACQMAEGATTLQKKASPNLKAAGGRKKTTVERRKELLESLIAQVRRIHNITLKLSFLLLKCFFLLNLILIR